MNKLTPHPRLPNKFIVESGDYVPLARAEAQRIGNMFESRQIQVEKSVAIEPVSRPAKASATIKDNDPNRVFDTGSFFGGLLTTQVRGVASKSAATPEDDNAIFDSVFPFFRS